MRSQFLPTQVDQHLTPREEEAMELELERLRIEERFHGAFESCGGSSLDSLELRALSSSPASSSLGCADRWPMTILPGFTLP